MQAFHLLGTIGKGFDDFSIYQNLLLISIGKTRGGLFSFIETESKSGKNIAYLLDDSCISLPHSVEILMPEMLEESFEWADFIAIEMERGELVKRSEILQKVIASGVQSQILVYSPMLCSGEAHCMICSIKTKKGWVRSCHEGSVYNLSALELE